MKAKGRFISFLLVVDTFFVAYAYGFHSRQVLIVDPKLPPVVLKKEVDKQALGTKVIEKGEGQRSEKNDSVGKGKAAAKQPVKKSESKKTAGQDKAGKDKTSAVKSTKKVPKKSPPAAKAKES